jgi:hypothetical protein
MRSAAGDDGVVRRRGQLAGPGGKGAELVHVCPRLMAWWACGEERRLLGGKGIAFAGSLAYN